LRPGGHLAREAPIDDTPSWTAFEVLSRQQTPEEQKFFGSFFFKKEQLFISTSAN
jgi:hypothetical protein